MEITCVSKPRSEKRCTYFDFSNLHQGFDLSCHVERENDKDMFMGIIMGGDEYLTTLHNKIRISLLYKRYPSMNIRHQPQRIIVSGGSTNIPGIFRSSTVIECPLLQLSLLLLTQLYSKSTDIYRKHFHTFHRTFGLKYGEEKQPRLIF